MKTKFLLLIVALILSTGCNQLNRLTGNAGHDKETADVHGVWAANVNRRRGLAHRASQPDPKWERDRQWAHRLG